jgi:hypothetical protein
LGGGGDGFVACDGRRGLPRSTTASRARFQRGSRTRKESALRFLTPYRLAAYLLVLFCAGHTFGGMLSEKSFGLASDAVFAGMKTVEFDFNGSTSTWYGFWFGFGMLASVFLVFSAIAAWQLDKVAPEQWPAVSVIAWALVASQACNAVLSWKYFFAGPGIFAALATALLAAGALQKQAVARRPAAGG